MNTTALIIGYVWPEPHSSAAGSRMLQLIRALQDGGYQVHYASPAEFSEHAADLPVLGISPQRITLNCSSFDEYVQTLNPALVLFDRFMMEEQFGWRVEQQCPQALRILDTEDLHCLRHARHEQLKYAVKEQGDTTVLPLQVENRFLFSELAVREIAAILRCDLSLMISTAEMELLQQRFQVPATQLLYLPFMEHNRSPEHIQGFSARQHFVAIGNFRHEPNWDAVRYLKEQIWPRIRRQLPQAELHIYGAYPPPKATQLHNVREGFLVKGWAADALQVVQQARVMLAPLRFGAGLKGKLIDAAQVGTPAVTSGVGAEGMYRSGAEPALIVDDTEALADAAVRLYTDEGLWHSLQQHGLRLIDDRFSYSEHAPRFLQTVQQLSSDIDAHRSQHFYNRMLRHHSLKSTQYMAQWIEAKNRGLKPASSTGKPA